MCLVQGQITIAFNARQGTGGSMQQWALHLRFRTGADAPGLLKLPSAPTATSGALTLLRTNLFKQTMDCMS